VLNIEGELPRQVRLRAILRVFFGKRVSNCHVSLSFNAKPLSSICWDPFWAPQRETNSRPLETTLKPKSRRQPARVMTGPFCYWV
jgi:hypothetical protein